jgi:hypothetical protein
VGLKGSGAGRAVPDGVVQGASLTGRRPQGRRDDGGQRCRATVNFRGLG